MVCKQDLLNAKNTEKLRIIDEKGGPMIRGTEAFFLAVTHSQYLAM